MPSSSVTLRQCYEWAREQSEDLKIRGEDIQQSQARARRAIGSAFPQVDWKFTDTWQDPAGIKKLETKGFSGFVEKDQVESRFTAKQPLFSGLREFSARAGFERESERDRLRMERAERELFEKTAHAFYAVIGYETDRTNTIITYDLAEGRLKELKGFLKLGKSRDSEVFTAKAHASALKGQFDQIQGNVASSREELSYLTGHDLSMLPLSDENPLPTALPDIKDVLSRAHERSDLRAQREDVAGRKLRVRYERGSYWPTADLTGNYYTKRATFLKDIDWDVVLEVGVPLYRGGKVSAAVREALSAYRQSLFALQQLERQVTFVVRKTLGDLGAAIQEAQSMEEASEAAGQSYDSLLKEYRLGLVNNLDVLQALDFLQTQQNARDSARLKAKRLFIQLKVATEEIP
jgi:outer membrane protein